MENPRQITIIQATIILASTIIGVGVLALPRFAVEAMDAGAPLVTFAGILLASCGLIVITLLGSRFPNSTIIQYSEQLIGKWPAKLGSLMIILFFAFLTSLAAREFGEVIVTSVLRKTPLEVTVIMMLLLAAVSARKNITTFAYIHHFYFPLILAPALVIIVFSLKNANYLHLLPLWGNHPQGITTGMLTIAALFQGSFILTMIIPSMRRPEKAMKASFWGMLIAGGLYLITVIACVSVFGAQEINLLLWPTLELGKMTSLPGQILERLDAGFLAVWVTAVFTTLFSSYLITIHATSQLFKLRDHRLFSFFIIPFVFVLAMQPNNILHMYQVIQYIGRIGLIITIVYPGMLLLVAVIRKKRGARKDENINDTVA